VPRPSRARGKPRRWAGAGLRCVQLKGIHGRRPPARARPHDARLPPPQLAARGARAIGAPTSGARGSRRSRSVGQDSSRLLPGPAPHKLISIKNPHHLNAQAHPAAPTPALRRAFRPARRGFMTDIISLPPAGAFGGFLGPAVAWAREGDRVELPEPPNRACGPLYRSPALLELVHGSYHLSGPSRRRVRRRSCSGGRHQRQPRLCARAHPAAVRKR
jgi:hypothetical protein